MPSCRRWGWSTTTRETASGPECRNHNADQRFFGPKGALRMTSAGGLARRRSCRKTPRSRTLERPPALFSRGVRRTMRHWVWPRLPSCNVFMLGLRRHRAAWRFERGGKGVAPAWCKRPLAREYLKRVCAAKTATGGGLLARKEPSRFPLRAGSRIERGESRRACYRRRATARRMNVPR